MIPGGAPEPARHPTFGRWFQAFFLRAWLALAATFALCLVLSKKGVPVPGAILGIAFGAGGILLIGYMFYRMRHVECPDCGETMKTYRNAAQSRYDARCPRCGKAWDIGIGIGD